MQTEEQNHISSRVKTKLPSDSADDIISEIENLGLVYIDLPKKTNSQKQQLIGKFASLFGDSVSNHKVAVETLLTLFREKENEFNTGGHVSFSDANKFASNIEIENAINIIKNKQMALEVWKTSSRNISERLSLSLLDRKSFETYMINSFDLFKDLSQIEHQKILNYTIDNKSKLSRICHSEEEFVDEISKRYLSVESPRLDYLQIKAAFYAAYFESQSI